MYFKQQPVTSFIFAAALALALNFSAANAEDDVDPAPVKKEKPAQTEVLNTKSMKAATDQKTAETAKPADTQQAPSEKPSDSGKAEEPKKEQWQFAGMDGKLDKEAAQRGFQVYKQVCSACHSMNLVAYRSLSKIGFEENEVKAIAAEKQVPDFDDKGEPVQRPGKPYDHFVPPYANEDASRAANGGAYPPDLSLIIKARENGPDYVYSLLTGFGNPPAGVEPVANKYYNPYFANHWISMPPPLSQGVLDYQDGKTATVDQMARDVVVFLQWAAEPETQERHEIGTKVLVFLALMSVFFFIAKRRVWKNIEH